MMHPTIHIHTQIRITWYPGSRLDGLDLLYSPSPTQINSQSHESINGLQVPYLSNSHSLLPTPLKQTRCKLHISGEEPAD